MGFGNRRVMALGVPLMCVVTVSQFRAILAHEFGHYYGGDTRLGPWIYKTRSAIGRTLVELERRNSWLIVLFRWYGNMFLRVTFAISRAQEYAADRLSAQFAGARALVEGLKQLHRGGVAWSAYLRGNVIPVLSAGFSPPLSAGFTHFLQSPSVQTPIEQSLEKELVEGKADPMDSHPALPERIAALRELPERAAEDNRMATDLLENFESADTGLFILRVKHHLKPVAWEEVTERVWVPAWRKQIELQQDAFAGMAVADLAKQLRDGKVFQHFKNPKGVWPDKEERDKMATAIAGCALAVALSGDGWSLHALPGEMYCEKGEVRIEPFTIVKELRKGEVTNEQWRELCARAGIVDLQLMPPVPTVAAN